MTTPDREAPEPGGVFISFEGGEGSGKSTQIKILADRLRRAGRSVVLTREPGGSLGAEIMRHVILSGVGKMLGGDAEAMLFAAARDDHVSNVIEPALARGQCVLCDRFYDSSRAYQGNLGKVDRGLLDALQRVTIGSLKPDITFILDVPVEIGLHRASVRRDTAAPDRFEAEDVDFHRQLRAVYQAVASAEPERCVLIDANRDAESVADAIWNSLQHRFPAAVAEKLKSA